MQVKNNNEPTLFLVITLAKRLMTAINGKCADKQMFSAAGDGSPNKNNFPNLQNGKFYQHTKV